MISNYCAHALEDEKKVTSFIRKNGGDEGSENIAMFYRILKESVKFRTPENGVILGLPRSEWAPVMREFGSLPFPSIALEFEATRPAAAGRTQCRERIALCNQLDSSAPIDIFSMVRANGCWIPTPSLVRIHRDGILEAAALAGMCPPGTGRLVAEAAIEDMTAEVLAVIELLAALSCSNVHAEDVDPPQALNKARTRRGKAPFFTYKILTIEANRPKGQGVSGVADRLSPRVHLRRGHIRHLERRNVWVNAAVVGDKSKGMVVKDYAVH